MAVSYTHLDVYKRQHYYSALQLPGRIAYADHHGGHEILVEEGLAFLQRHL